MPKLRIRRKPDRRSLHTKTMFYTTKGLILRETQYKDNDKLLDVLTGDMGRITVKARGVRRKNSRLRSGCQLLCYSELTLFEKNGFYTVNEAEPLEMFMGLRTDIELLSLGSYFAQLLSCISDQDQASPELLSLGLNSLYALDKLKKPQPLVKAAFELRLMALAGYYPELSGCGGCGEEGTRFFCFQEGSLLCEDCRRSMQLVDGVELSQGVLDAMEHILHCPAKRLFSFTLPDKQLKALGEVTERYLICQLDQSFYALDFYKRLFTTS